jgi:hypothetical protein
MKKRALVLLALMTIIAGTMGLSHPTIAEESATKTTGSGLTASPEQIKYGILMPGSNYTKPLHITNTTDTDLTFSLSTATYQDVELSDDYTKITEWLTIVGSTDYTLKPEASTDINIRVRVPKDAPAGGQYASIIAAVSDQIYTMANISAIISSEDLQHSGELVSSKLPGFSLAPEINTSATIKNTGNVDFDATIKLTVRSIFGGDPIHDDTLTQTVFPGTTAELSQDWTDAPVFGFFSATQTITYVNASGEQIERITDRVILICPIWLIIILAVVILGIIGLIIFLIIHGHNKDKLKKHHKKASWEQEEDR